MNNHSYENKRIKRRKYGAYKRNTKLYAACGGATARGGESI